MKLANTSKNQQAAAPQAAADPGILEMGTSVTVNDELRRALTAEIRDIDAVSAKLNENVSKEESMKGEQLKSKTRAENEMAGICQEAAENVEKLSMSKHMFSGFANTFSKEMGVAENETSEISSVVDMKKTLNKNREAAANARGSMDKHSTVCHNLMNAKKETTETWSALLHEIEDSLKGSVKNEQHDTAEKAETLEEEEKRSNTWKANRGVIDARNTANSKTLNELIEQVNAEKLDFQNKESDFEKRLAAAKEEAAREEKELEELEAELSNLSLQLEQLVGPADEVTNLIAERDTEKAKLEKDRAERSALFAQQTELGKSIASVKETLDHDRGTIIKEEKTAAISAKEKAANDKLEKDKIEAVRVELADKKTQKEMLEAWESDGSNAAKKKEYADDLEGQKQRLEQLQCDTEQAAQDLEGKKAKEDENRRLLEDREFNYKNEHDKKEKRLKGKFKEIKELEQKNLDESAEKENSKACDEQYLAELQRKYEVCRTADQYLENHAEKMRKIEAGTT